MTANSLERVSKLIHVALKDEYTRDRYGQFSETPGSKVSVPDAKSGSGEKSSRMQRFADKGLEEATKEDRERLKLPPAWKNVMVDRREDAAMLAVGDDAKGREQRVYSAEHHENQAAAKFSRLEAMHQRMPALDKTLVADAKDDDTALSALMIRRMGLRPGSDRDTGAEKAAYGATNLPAGSVTTDGDKVRLKFTGKKGVALDLEVEDGQLAGLLRGRKEGKKDDDRLLDTDDRKLRDYFGKSAKGIKPKDLRTYLGTAKAKELVDGMEKPDGPKGYQKARKAVADEVSKLLGNTPTVALTSYIAPSVFGPWEDARA